MVQSRPGKLDKGILRQRWAGAVTFVPFSGRSHAKRGDFEKLWKGLCGRMLACDVRNAGGLRRRLARGRAAMLRAEGPVPLLQRGPVAGAVRRGAESLLTG